MSRKRLSKEDRDERDKKVVALRTGDKMAYADIAKLLGMSPSEVHRSLKRQKATDAHLRQDRDAMIVSLYTVDKMEPEELANKFNLSLSRTYGVLYEHCVAIRGRSLTEEQEAEVVRLYHTEKMSALEASYVIGCSEGCIYNTLRRVGQLPRTSDEARPFYSQQRESRYSNYVNPFALHDAHKTEQGCYFLGLLLTDGYIVVNGPNTWGLGLSLAEDSLDALQKWQKYLDATDYRIRGYKGKRNRDKQKMFKLDVANQILTDKAIEYGIEPQKTSNQRVDDRLKDSPHFWRGVIDGDGTYYWHGNYPSLCLSSTSHQLMNSWKAFVEGITGNSKSLIYCTLESNLVACKLFLRGTDAQKVTRCLYENSTVYLERKKKLADSILLWKPKRRKVYT